MSARRRREMFIGPGISTKTLTPKRNQNETGAINISLLTERWGGRAAECEDRAAETNGPAVIPIDEVDARECV
jgi:hypothetical protein